MSDALDIPTVLAERNGTSDERMVPITLAQSELLQRMDMEAARAIQRLNDVFSAILAGTDIGSGTMVGVRGDPPQLVVKVR